MSDLECAELLPINILKGQIETLLSARSQILASVSEIDAKIANLKYILAQKTLAEYKRQGEIMEKITKGDMDLFLCLIDEIILADHSIFCFFKELSMVYIEIAFREQSIFKKSSKRLNQLTRHRNCSLIMLYSI